MGCEIAQERGLLRAWPRTAKMANSDPDTEMEDGMLYASSASSLTVRLINSSSRSSMRSVTELQGRFLWVRELHAQDTQQNRTRSSRS